jgi:RNA polymerase sigma-70 factor (ECF subfamily)
MDVEQAVAQFEPHRRHLRTVAYRMLGSLDEAEDAVQETWLRFARTDVTDVANLRGWLVTVTSRICLDHLRARTTRQEEPFSDHPTRPRHLPDPVITAEGGDPEHEALLADAVGLALQVVIAELTPAERIAFVLHDLFAIPFTDIGDLLGRSPAASKQLAHRARRRVSDAAPTRQPDRSSGRTDREVVEAFFAAARSGDLDRLVSVLHPDVVARTDGGTARASLTGITRGARNVAHRARTFANPHASLHPVLADGDPGVIVTLGANIVSVLSFTVRDGQVVALHALADPERLARLDVQRFLQT